MPRRFGLDDPIPTFAGSFGDRATTEADFVALDDEADASKPVDDGPLSLVWLPRAPGARVMPLQPGRYRLGRAPSRILPPLEIELEDDAVSRLHATLEVSEKGVVTIEDKRSTNGVRVNNTRVSRPTALRPGDVMLIGNTRLRLLGRLG